MRSEVGSTSTASSIAICHTVQVAESSLESLMRLLAESRSL